MTDLVKRAKRFARVCHAGQCRRRCQTNEPKHQYLVDGNFYEGSPLGESSGTALLEMGAMYVTACLFNINTETTKRLSSGRVLK